VEFQKIPDLPCGPSGTAELKGKITGLSSFSGVHVVIYSKCDGMYYVQPTVASPKTEIEDNGTFSADVHGAQEFVVLVVKDDYKPEAQMESLPGTGRNVLAVAKKRPEKK